MHYCDLLSGVFRHNEGKPEDKFLLGAKRQAFNLLKPEIHHKPILGIVYLTNPSVASSVEW
jgi:hypothetical protein